MFIDGLANFVDLVRLMQLVGDLQNEWMMFDYVKHVEEWTTMVCHICNLVYCKMMTIIVYNI
jgi:hypothetical protein